MRAAVMSLGDCLKPRQPSFCGNGIVETGEQCDCGTTYTCDVHDKCCTPLSLHPLIAGGTQVGWIYLSPPMERSELKEIMRLVDLSICVSVCLSVYTYWQRYAL